MQGPTASCSLSGMRLIMRATVTRLHTCAVAGHGRHLPHTSLDLTLAWLGEVAPPPTKAGVQGRPGQHGALGLSARHWAHVGGRLPLYFHCLRNHPHRGAPHSMTLTNDGWVTGTASQHTHAAGPTPLSQQWWPAWLGWWWWRSHVKQAQQLPFLVSLRDVHCAKIPIGT